MKVLYTRVSTTEQNVDRQVIDKDQLRLRPHRHLQRIHSII